MAALGMTGLGRSVAIVDSGLDLTHPDFLPPEGAPSRVRGGISFAGAPDDREGWSRIASELEAAVRAL